MNEHSFMRVDDVAQELGVSKSYAYKLIQRLNAELREKGYQTPRSWEELAGIKQGKVFCTA